jgi:hypothetical protein
MANKEESRLLKHALSRYGLKAQVMQTMEEVGELLQALNKVMRNPDTGNHYRLAEEIADVEIILEQMKVGFRLDGIAEKIRGQKLLRLAENLKANYYPSEEVQSYDGPSAVVVPMIRPTHIPTPNNCTATGSRSYECL